MQVILLDLHLFLTPWSLGSGGEQVEEFGEASGNTELTYQHSSPALLDGRQSCFWNFVYLRLFSFLITSPSSLCHPQKAQTGLAPPYGSHSLPSVLGFLLKINRISFPPMTNTLWFHVLQPHTTNSDSRARHQSYLSQGCSAACVLVGYPGKEEDGENNQNSLCHSQWTWEVLTDFL